jgi:glycosyltransferase involved in cell wall biosynthesis
MNIAIDISPLSSGHKVRGTGFYLQHLKDALVKYFPEHSYTFFQTGERLLDDIEVVHYPYFDPFFLTLPFGKIHKTVVTVHDLTPLVFPSHFPAGLKGTLKWQMQRFNLKNIDGILTDSKASKRDIVKIVGFPEERVDVAYLAAGEEFKKYEVSNSKYKVLREKYNLPEEFVLYVGDVTWNKNLPRLLKAIQKFPVQLVMAGKSLVSKEFDRSNKWNKDLIEIQRLAKENNNVHLLGFVPTEDLVSLYNLATVFVFPSVYEGFGLPILEAMQCGCPVIITREGCMPEVGGDAAFYFDGYDTESLASAIKQVYSSKELQKELTDKGLKQAEKFSWRKTAEETLKAYEKALNSA